VKRRKTVLAKQLASLVKKQELNLRCIIRRSQVLISESLKKIEDANALKFCV
jgi:hypothetical protein